MLSNHYFFMFGGGSYWILFWGSALKRIAILSQFTPALLKCAFEILLTDEKSKKKFWRLPKSVKCLQKGRSYTPSGLAWVGFSEKCIVRLRGSDTSCCPNSAAGGPEYPRVYIEYTHDLGHTRNIHKVYGGIHALNASKYTASPSTAQILAL